MAQRLAKVTLVVVIALATLVIGLPSALSYYDAQAKESLLRVVAKELPPRASHREMTELMQRHTTTYAFDDKYHHDYAGFVPQTQLDKSLFNRKVQVLLKVNDDQTFREADVRVFYTFL